MRTYECAFESLRHPRSNDGSHVEIRSIPVIFKPFEKKVHAFHSCIAYEFLLGNANEFHSLDARNA